MPKLPKKSIVIPGRKVAAPFSGTRYDPKWYQSPLWKRFRRDHIILFGIPYCAMCGKFYDKRMTLDHKIPRWQRPDLQFDHNNVQWLCPKCVNIKNNKDRAGIQAPGDDPYDDLAR